LGLSRARLTAPDARGDWDATSGHDVHFHVYAKGQTSKLVQNVADAKARTEIEFNSSDSFAFAAHNVQITTATEFSDVLTAIRHAYHERHDLPEDERWDKDLAYVFAVGDADRFTALIARSSDTDVVVTGKGKVGPPASAADLALGVEIGVSSKELEKANSAPAHHYFYRAYRLNPSVFRQWDDERLQEVSGTEGIEPVTEEQILYLLDQRPPPSFDEMFEPVESDVPAAASS